ncbi:hypothetical protein ACFWY5_49085 [Nonomuraea sp. NPDC059007]|uniref:hypothetical protein n=1 Tax=Nonomuraea sp. NPDC059007 TaxID=3346692 RepID=UPI0036AC9F6F
MGWDIWLLALRWHLATGDAVAGDIISWTESAAGHTFVTNSSRRWADASILAGTPEAQARAAESRITSFYANH